MNIEKFLNVMINLKVEKLVLNNIEPPYVIKGGKKNPVLKRILTKNELEIIVWEYQKMFSNSETLTYRNKNIDVKVMDKCLEFTIRVNSDIKEEILESVQEKELEKTKSFPSMGITVNEASDTIDLDQLFRLMVEKNASDLHLPSGCRPAMRIDGDIVQLVNFPLISEKKLSDELNKIIPERNSKEFNQTNDTDFAYEIKGVARFRSNTIYPRD
jgi:Tfp pilus assembly pilus retraction ATPase PilT